MRKLGLVGQRRNESEWERREMILKRGATTNLKTRPLPPEAVTLTKSKGKHKERVHSHEKSYRSTGEARELTLYVADFQPSDEVDGSKDLRGRPRTRAKGRRKDVSGLELFLAAG